MRTVLVTGGAGFLGSHLCDLLIARGDAVICLDNFVTGRIENVRHNLHNMLFKLVRQDVVDPFDVGVDRIYNLACPASPKHYQRDPIATFRSNVVGAFNVLELAARAKARVLQASTSEVYGDPHVHPQHEGFWGNVNPIGPRACYDEGKRSAETLFFDFRRQHALGIKVARIFNTYGPRMQPDDGRVVSNFIVQALLGRDITIYGDGTQTRSFCYVDDLVDGLARLMDSADDVTGPVNLGNPEEYQVQEVAAVVLEMIGSRSRLVRRPLPVDDPRRRRPDIGIARKLLGWEPRVGLREGLERTIAYFDAFLCDNGTAGLEGAAGTARRRRPTAFAPSGGRGPAVPEAAADRSLD